MFQKILAGDTIFSITKKQRDLFLVVSIYDHNRVFTDFHHLMPSKEARSYNWVTRLVMRHLLNDTNLSYNQGVLCD